MVTEIEFLKARLDEREARYDVGDFEEVDSARGPGWGLRYCGICGEHGWEGREAVTEDAAYEHLDQNHERTFVLAEITAQRKIIEINESWPLLLEGKVEFGFDGSKAGDYAMVMAQQIAWTTNQKYREAFGDEPPTTPVIRALIQPFSDHPDFDPSWRMA